MQDIVAQTLNERSKDNRYKEIFIEDIHPSQYNIYPMSELTALAKNIEEVGLMHPIVVLQIDEDCYEIISGERRYRAMKLLYEGGNADYEMIPAMIRITDMDIRQKKRMIRRGNASRPELTLEEKIEITKESYEDYLFEKAQGNIEKGIYKRDWIAMDTGFSPRSVSTYLAEMDSKDELRDDEDIEEVKHDALDPYLKKVQDKMQSNLGTKVRLAKKSIRINFAGIDDLNRILRRLGFSEMEAEEGYDEE